MQWLNDRNFEPERAVPWKGQPFGFVQAKRDGYRVTAVVDEVGDVRLYGRSWLARPDLEFLGRFPGLRDTRWLDRIKTNFAPCTVIDGELWMPGKPASYVSTALRSSPGLLIFDAFAVPFLGGMDLRREPWVEVERTLMRLSMGAFSPVPSLNHLEMHVSAIMSTAEITSRLLNLTLSNTEGWVLKAGHYDRWYKLKAERTVDCVITGTKEGQGKYLGLLGALRVSLFDGIDAFYEIANVSGMTDEQRIDMSLLDDEDKLVGRVVEVQYQYLGEKKRLRHPRFKRFRDDKPSYECTMDQLL